MRSSQVGGAEEDREWAGVGEGAARGRASVARAGVPPPRVGMGPAVTKTKVERAAPTEARESQRAQWLAEEGVGKAARLAKAGIRESEGRHPTPASRTVMLLKSSGLRRQRWRL